MKYRLFLVLVTTVALLEAVVVHIGINTSEAIETVSERFLSFTIDTSMIQANWSTLNFSSTKVQTLAKSLKPSYLRVGGTTADYCLFNTSSKIGPVAPRFKNFTMTVAQWDELNGFVELVGLDLIFDLNSLLRKNGQWLPDNAKLLLDYTSQKGYKIAGWELGNEPDLYHAFGYKINGSTHANDYKQLHSLLNQYPQWRNTTVIGPSVTMLNYGITITFLKDFLETGGPNIVNNPTFHHYYGAGKTATIESFMNPKLLDSLISQINVGKKLGPHPPYGKFWLGETSTFYGGGTPGLSDRYVAGFMWLDKLGLSARLGLDVVIRQDFYGLNYSLIDTKTLDPNPDYWLSYLYKILVGQSVLNVTIEDTSGYVRMYAHCTNTKSAGGLYKPGSVTVYGMNLKEEPATVLFPQFKEGTELHLYLLEPVGKDGLKSQSVALNGRTLKLTSPYSNLPNVLTPEIVTESVTFPQQSFGFIVIPQASAAVCQKMKEKTTFEDVDITVKNV